MFHKNILNRGKNKTLVVATILAVVSLIALLFSTLLTDNLRDKIAINQIKLVSERTEAESLAFYEQLNSNLKLIAGLVQSGIFSDNEIETWSSAFYADLQLNRNISAVTVSSEDGTEYYASLSDSSLIYYRIGKNDSNEVIVHSKNLETDSVTTLDTIITNRAINLDSYTRQLSIPPDSVVWYKIQPLPGISTTLGLAASVKTINKASGNANIITIYVSVHNIYNFLETIAEHVKAEIFLFTLEHEVFDIESKIDTLGEPLLSDYLVKWDSVKTPAYKKAILKWEDISNKDSIQFQSFKLDKQKYWGAYRPIQKQTANLWAALIIAEDDFLTVLKSRIGILFFIPILFLLVSGIVLVVVIRGNIKTRKKETFGIAEILKLIEKGENEHVEFKSTIRTNLYTNNPGKEIELAWLKSVVGFCNSNGGTILIGINDEGEVVGIEPDKFANDDKCLLHVQSLLRDHVGMEFTVYIKYKLLEIDEKKVLAVRCTPSPKPVFLSSNNKEQFFVRSGPASIELPISKALKYIEDRNKK
ncbi:AlbA family DNA-binding domain-containing protein [Maribellus mangrovi]|uniref:AlbA family DNA-binding domain-containing protein n=1 Tax=Maribellus mangrovi TaxID=3133146 RepID=UPI0030EF9763